MASHQQHQQPVGEHAEDDYDEEEEVVDGEEEYEEGEEEEGEEDEKEEVPGPPATSTSKAGEQQPHVHNRAGCVCLCLPPGSLEYSSLASLVVLEWISAQYSSRGRMLCTWLSGRAAAVRAVRVV